LDANNIIALGSFALAVAGLIGTSHQVLHRRISSLRDEIAKIYMPRETAGLRLDHMDEKLNEIHSDVKHLLGRKASTSAE
jgi:hypothetical protein